MLQPDGVEPPPHDDLLASAPQSQHHQNVRHSAAAICLGFFLAFLLCALDLRLHQRYGLQFVSGALLGAGLWISGRIRDGWRGGWITSSPKTLYIVCLLGSSLVFTGTGLVAVNLVAHPSAGFAVFFLVSTLLTRHWISVSSARSETAWQKAQFQFGIDALFPRRFPPRLHVQAVVDITADGTGNGFLIRDDGVVLTAAHVVGDRDYVWVTLINGELFQGRVTHRDTLCDCALVKIDAPFRLPVFRLGSVRKMRYGDAVLVLGWEPPDRRDYLAPLAGTQCLYVHLEEPSVVPMNVAQFSSPPEEDHNVSLFILSGSDLVREGYSGGPVCCPRTGDVLGMTCWGVTDLKLGVCVPSDVLRSFLVRCGISPQSTLLWQMPSLAPTERWRHNEIRLRCLRTFRHPGFGNLDAMRAWPHLQEDRDQMNDAVRVFPEYQDAWTIRGWLRWAQGDAEGADEDAREALRLGYSGPACILRRRLAQDRQQWEEAVSYARMYYEHCPGCPGQAAQPERIQAVQELAALLQQQGRHEEVLSLCAEEHISDVSTLVLQAVSLWATDRGAEARDLLRGVVAREPGQGNARWTLMGVLADLGGQEHFREVIQLGLNPPADVDVVSLGLFVALARAYTGLGLDDKAREASELDAALRGEEEAEVLHVKG